MPDGYAHLRTAEQALLKSGIFIYDRAAFCMGAQGPDAFFFHDIWKARRDKSINELGSTMHEESTGAFLAQLVQCAKSPLQKSFVLGFLTHYATDCSAHPYVAAMTNNGAPYCMNEGHGFYEIALDSDLYELDYGKRQVPLSRSTLLPDNAEMYELCALLHAAISTVYQIKLPVSVIYECYTDMRFARRMLRSRFGVMRAVYSLAEEKLLKRHGYLLSHLTPAQKMQELPKKWINQYDGNKLIQGGIHECLKNAVAAGGLLIKAADTFWNNQGGGNVDTLKAAIGNKSYSTGQETHL